MKTKTLKKLGLGVSAFACIITSTANVAAATAKEGTSTVTYDSRTVIDGGTGDSGTYSWGAVIPSTIKLDDSADGVEQTIEIIDMASGTSDALSTLFSELTIKASVKSAGGYSLTPVSDTGANGNPTYTLQIDGNNTAFTASNDSFQDVTNRLGIGTNTVDTDSQKNQVNSTKLTLTAKLVNASQVAEGKYTDTLTFQLTELKRTEI